MVSLPRVLPLVLAACMIWAPAAGAEEIPLPAGQAGPIPPPEGPAPQELAIQNVLTAKLMGGYPDGQFHAEGQLTRAQLASIINRVFTLDQRSIPPEVALRDPQMPVDVSPKHWAYNDIWTVLKHGIMQGYREGAFHPDYPVSRAEALAIFAQAYGVYQFNDATVHDILADYPDADQVPDWARKAMATALRQGFVNAQPGQSIRPLQPMTRGDMAYALNEYMNRLYESEKPTLPQE